MTYQHISKMQQSKARSNNFFSSSIHRKQTEKNGTTLPYREATELANCTRIMGEENASYCREEVLGEQKTTNQELSDSNASATSCATAVCYNCDPQPVSYQQFLNLARTNNWSQDAFGITVLDSQNITTPSIALNSNNQLIPSNCSASISSHYIQAGSRFPDSNGNQPMNTRDIRNCSSPIIHYLITRSGANRIAEGEREHCADFQRAFSLTFGHYTNALNRIARTRRHFRNTQQAMQAIDRRAGISFSRLSTTFECLARKTKLRDRRGLHNSTAQRATLFPSQRRCRYPLVRLTGANLPGVGTLSSENLIRGCGVPSP